VPYVLKIDALANLQQGNEIEITERYFYGGDAVIGGDEAFVWFSGVNQRLAWLAEVVRVGPLIDRRVTVLIRLTSPSASDAMTIAQLIPFRDIRDDSGLSGLSRKLYRHAHNKVAAVSEAEAVVLRQYFPI
jgi:hypothetical protein